MHDDATGRALVEPGTVTDSGLPATAGSGVSVTSVGVITPEPARARVSAARGAPKRVSGAAAHRTSSTSAPARRGPPAPAPAAAPRAAPWLQEQRARQMEPAIGRASARRLFQHPAQHATPRRAPSPRHRAAVPCVRARRAPSPPWAPPCRRQPLRRPTSRRTSAAPRRRKRAWTRWKPQSAAVRPPHAPASCASACDKADMRSLAALACRRCCGGRVPHRDDHGAARRAPTAGRGSRGAAAARGGESGGTLRGIAAPRVVQRSRT